LNFSDLKCEIKLLGKKRLRQHLEYVIANLNYAEIRGRMSIIELLGEIIQSFPVEIITKGIISKFVCVIYFLEAQFFFLPLVLALNNDTDTKCRNMLAIV
jgi:U3 small nucleolar RNA-associated protein 20